ncbi:MAG TPA: zinc-binding dehydrogenase [Pseudoneobacillus sp.]|nr:zinc-binding dehydrogenase [Pseudoneobacillus sp.]
MINQRMIIPSNEEFQLIEEQCMEPKENEVRIKVLATGVAFADIMMRKGRYPGAPPFPFTPGHEVVGIIESIGTKVTTLQKGQLIAAFCKYGGYARYVNLPEKVIVSIPDGVDPYEVAAMILNYVTAYQILHRDAQIKDGDSILIHGAAGGMGTALLQLSQGENRQLFGTASFKNKEKVLSHGAQFIDYQNENFVERILAETNDGVDFVLDAIGGYHWKRSYQALKPDGLFIGYGLTYAADDEVQNEEHQFMSSEWNQILNTNQTSSGNRGIIYSISKADPSTITEDLKRLLNLLLNKKIKPKIAAKFPLSQATEAHRLFEKGADGKILLICND